MSPTLIHTTNDSISVAALDRQLRSRHDFPCEVRFHWPGLSPLRWLSVQPPAARLAWIDRGQSSPVAAWGMAASVLRRPEESSAAVLDRCRQILDDHASLRMYGGFSFDDSRACGPEWSAFGRGRFWLPRLTYDGRFLRVLVRERDDIDQARADLACCVMDPAVAVPPVPVCAGWQDHPSLQQWQELLGECQSLLEREILEKIVLVRRRELTLDQPACPWDLLSRIKQPHDTSYLFCFQPDEQTSFLGISPERLFSRRGADFESEAVAGTRPRGQDDDSDQQLAAELQSSAKEQLEHDIVRKSIRQRLHRFVDDLQVDTTAQLLRLPSMQHLYSRVQGRLKPGVDDGTLIDRLHPTPALGGYPTENALAEIQRLEPFDRGWYGAPVGWVSRDAAEFAVGIRSALISAHRMYLYSGAGIVPGSTADGEWRELDQKVRDYLHVFGLEDQAAVHLPAHCAPADHGGL